MSSADDSSHDEAMSQFCGVTGATEERAKSLLEACDWNLDLAISMHLDTEDGRSNNNGSGPSTSAGPGAGSSRPGFSIHNDSTADSLDLDAIINGQDGSSSGGRRRPVNNRDHHLMNDSDEIRPPIAPIRQVLINSPISYVPETTRRYNTRGGSAAILDPFRDFEAEARWQEAAHRANETGGASDDANVNNDFGPFGASGTGSSGAPRPTTIEDLFRPPLDMMFRGAFVDARDKSTAENKWLLVNIQNCREFACQTLNRDVWSEQTVKDIVREHFIFWQVYHDTHEGGKFVQFYRVGSQPFVSIIDPRTGESMKTWTASTLDKTTFCDSIIEFLTDHPSPDGSGYANKMKKIRVKPEEEREKEKEKEKEKEREKERERARQKPVKMEEEVAEKEIVEIEDDDETEEEDEGAQDDDDEVEEIDDNHIDPNECTCRIALRFPDGTSQVQKFSPQHKLAAIRSFVRRHLQNKNPPKLSQIEFVAPPNKKLTSIQMSESLEKLGLTPASRLEVVFNT